MKQVQKGDRVRIDYTGKLEDGTIFDTTLDIEECESDDCASDDCGCEAGPMDMTIGEGDFFAQVEDALVGMVPGGKKTVVIPAGEGFGEYDEERVFTVPRSHLPEELVPEVGQELTLTNEDNESLEVVVVEVNAEEVTFDANHPLAGEDLTYEIELLEIL
jgi:peptidylprolyl isomerase